MGFVKKRLQPRLLVVYALALGLVLYVRPTPTGLWLGGALVLLGESLRIWGTGYLHKNDDLTVGGPYSFLRHPLYLGTLLIACGFALLGPSKASLVLLGVFVSFYFGYYVPYKDRIETARLEAAYGDVFRRYAVAVPRILPRLTAYRPLSGDRVTRGGWRFERFADNNEAGTAVAVLLGISAIGLRWFLG